MNPRTGNKNDSQPSRLVPLAQIASHFEKEKPSASERFLSHCLKNSCLLNWLASFFRFREITVRFIAFIRAASGHICGRFNCVRRRITCPDQPLQPACRAARKASVVRGCHERQHHFFLARDAGKVGVVRATTRRRRRMEGRFHKSVSNEWNDDFRDGPAAQRNCLLPRQTCPGFASAQFSQSSAHTAAADQPPATASAKAAAAILTGWEVFDSIPASNPAGRTGV